MALEPDGWPGCGFHSGCKPTQKHRLSPSTFWTGHRSTASLAFTFHHRVDRVDRSHRDDGFDGAIPVARGGLVEAATEVQDPVRC